MLHSLYHKQHLLFLESYQDHLAAGAARRFLEEAIKISKLEGGYADFARRTLNILIEAEREVHKDKRMPVATLDHAETHRQMIPHDHGKEVMLHEAQDILIDHFLERGYQ